MRDSGDDGGGAGRLLGEAEGVPEEWLQPRWSIADAAQHTGVPIDTLRYYERAGVVTPVARTDGGARRYSELDLERIACARWLREAGLPIGRIVEFEALREQGRQTLAGRRTLLAEHRVALAERRAQLDACLRAVDAKVARYDALLAER